MVKKLRKIAQGKEAAGMAGLQGSQLAATVKDSAQQIWLAGLGAFSKAQAEGTKVFEALVKEGTSLQRKTQAVAEEKIGEVTGRMTEMANDVGTKAGQRWDKLEAIFEDRVSKALGRLGVPASKDVDALIRRIDELGAKVAALSKSAGTSAGKTRPAPAKTTGAAAKRAPRKAA